MAIQPLSASSLRSLPFYCSFSTRLNSLSSYHLPFVARLKPHKTLHIPCSSSPASSPTFFSPVESLHTKSDQIDSNSDGEPESEPMMGISKGRVPGLNIFQDQLEEMSDSQETQLEENEQNQEPELRKSSTIEEILEIVRKLPENAILEEQLGAFVGRVSEADCVSLLKMLSQEGLVKECMHLFEWMRVQDPVLVTPRVHSVMFLSLGQVRMYEEIMALVKNLPKDKRFRDVRVYNSAISGLAKAGRYDYAWQVYEMLESNNIRPDHITCSILITIFRKTKGKTAKDAWNLFQSMTRRGARWSLESVLALIKFFCQEGLTREALIIQSDMEKRGISSNTFIYNTLMDTYVKSGEIENAEGLFQEMKERGLKPSIVSYNILMDAYSTRMQPEVVENLISELRDLGLAPDVSSYVSLISSYGRKKDSEMANDAFLHMKKEGIEPNTGAYAALVHAYSFSGEYEQAYITYQNMVSEGIDISIEAYLALLNAFRRAGDAEKTMEVWKYMMKNKVEETRVTFDIVLDCLAKNGLYVQAREVVYEFSKLGVNPTTMTYNMLINAYARGGQHYKIPELLTEMANLELKPDSITYLTIIYSYIRVHEFSKAFYYHKSMLRKGLMPDRRSSEKLKTRLRDKMKTKTMTDRSAILGIINSIKSKKGKKDEFWKNKKKHTQITNFTGGSRKRYL